MITWDENLLCAEDVKSPVSTIRRRLRWRRSTTCLTYCITYARNGTDLFDIYNMAEFMFKSYAQSSEELHIIGLAGSRETACELAGEIVGRVYERTGGFDVRGYFDSLSRPERTPSLGES